MTITEHHKELIQDTFAQVIPQSEKVAELFYARLFEIAPHLRPLFKNDIREQGRKLMQTLAVVVNGLDNLGEIIPAVKALGARHVHYGVKPMHYALVGDALLWTLRQGLGSAFTPDVEVAWTTAYTVIAETAIAGAAEAEAQPEF